MVMFIMNYYIHIYIHLHVGPSSMLVDKLNTWMNRLSALQGAAAEEALTSAIANGTDFDWVRNPDKTYQPRTWFKGKSTGFTCKNNAFLWMFMFYLHVETMYGCFDLNIIFFGLPYMLMFIMITILVVESIN